MKEHRFPAILNVVAGVGVVLVSFLMDSNLPVGREMARIAGVLVVYTGIAIVVWAGVHLKSGMCGMIEPKLDELVKDGPYRFVRHPVYLGTAISLIGVAITLRSLLGIVVALLLFIPTEVYRAKLEDKALARKFGSQWEEYASRTGFILPFIGRYR
jgi:protein-S-isoprenylcysteine O-methyltransferase Ste14